MDTDSLNNMVNEDFEIMNEHFSRWELKDGTILKIKIVLSRLFFSNTMDLDGYPSNYIFQADDIMTAIIPIELRNSEKSTKRKPLDQNEDMGEDIEFKEIRVEEQSYMTSSGYKFTIRPILDRVRKFKTYTHLGEPTYSADFQGITNIEKMNETRENSSNYVDDQSLELLFKKIRSLES